MRVLAGKEALELWRTRRFVILPVVFAAMGIMGPGIIRVLPILLERSPTPMDIDLPDFGPADGLAQYLELARQMGLLAVLLVFMGIFAGERRDGLLAGLFVKPVSRLRYVAVRWGVNGLYVLLSFALGSTVAVGYTLLLLGEPDYAAMVFASVLYLTYVLLGFSWTACFSALLKGSAAAAGLSLIPLFVIPIIGAIWEPLGTYGPYGAVAAGTAAIGGFEVPAQAIPGSAWVSAGVNLLLSAVLVLIAYRSLRNAEL